MTLQFKHTFENAECFAIDFATNESRPYFAAAFSDGYCRIWDLNMLTQGGGNGVSGGSNTLDKPKFEVEGAVEIGPVDVKFNPNGNRVAISSVNNALKVFNIQDDKCTLHKELSGEKAQAWKLDWHPEGTEILTGQLGIRTFGVDTLEQTKSDA